MLRNNSNNIIYENPRESCVNVVHLNFYSVMLIATGAWMVIGAAALNTGHPPVRKFLTIN